MIEEAIMIWLKAETTIKDKVADRIYYVEAPQLIVKSDAPFLVFDKISLIPSHQLGGAPTYAVSRIQFAIMGKTYLEVKSITEALKTLFWGYSKPVEFKMGNKVWVQSVEVDNEIDGKDNQSQTYFTVIDAMFYHVL